MLIRHPRFSPANLAAVKYWLDAGRISGIADGGAVAAGDVVDRSRSALGAWTATVGVKYAASRANGRPALEFTAASSSYGRSPSFVVTQPHYVFAVYEAKTLPGTWRLFDGNTVNRSVLQGASATGKIGLFAGTATLPTDTTFGTGNICLLEAFFSGASSTLQVANNTVVTGNPGGLGFSDGAILGAAGGLNAGFFADGYLFEFIVADSTLTADQRADIRAYLTAKHGLITKWIVADGNSLTFGTGLSAGQEWPAQLLPLVGGAGSWRLFNGGVPGQTTTQMSADAGTQIDPHATPGSVCFAWEVSNELIGGLSDVTALANFNTYMAARVSAGFTQVIPIGVIDRVDFTSQMRTYAASVNASLRLAYPTTLIDLVTLDTRFLDNTNRTIFQTDGIHTTAAADALIAGWAHDKMAALGIPVT